MTFSQEIALGDIAGLNVSIARFYRGYPRKGSGLQTPASHYLTVWWLQRGSGSVSREGIKPVIIQPGEVFICEPGAHRLQQFTPNTILTSMWLSIDWGVRMQPLIKGLPICFELSDYDELRQGCEDVLAILELHQATSSNFLIHSSLPFYAALDLRCLGFRIYQILLRAMKEHGCRLQWMELLDPRVRRAAKYLNQLHSPISVPYDVLTEITHLGRVQLDRLFKDNLGLTPKTYLAKQCFGEISDLLQHTTMNVRDIAEGFGFSSTAHFCKWFKRQTHRTPLEHRKHFIA